jgi:hypothetical protein
MYSSANLNGIYIRCVKCVEECAQKELFSSFGLLQRKNTGVQNKIIISESIYYTHLWVTPLQRGTEYITFSINLSVGFLGGMSNIQAIQTIFDLFPHCLKHVWCYHSHIVPYAGFQVLKVVDINLAR